MRKRVILPRDEVPDFGKPLDHSCGGDRPALVSAVTVITGRVLAAAAAARQAWSPRRHFTSGKCLCDADNFKVRLIGSVPD
ncbi:hypothetical protein MAUB_58190 [Mycolicibacterium aubagnense]|uniref:Uncharacterized protein n=1 Tax=Mycolicibacterium aubagnense TaxID=319707 RepID=A0ABN5Z1A2_9MYCO|nr:hypothetical protein MAUB_58190 [Mycolicibacterium aubagnense]